MANRKRRGRPVNGILVFDKPAGVSSNRALQNVKRLFYANKAGHTGSLDPLATGVLPICFGEATKFSQYFLDADKGYLATVVLGANSSTEDADGELTFVADASTVTQADVEQILPSLQGDQMQIPPMYSALKQNGQRLYKLARQGKEVERKARPITVYSIKLLDFRITNDNSQHVELDLQLEVSKGTYVRSIAAEIGRQLSVGAYLGQLRRTSVSLFKIADAVSLEQLEQLKVQEYYNEIDALLLPMADALPQIPSVCLDESSSYYLLQGNPVQVSQAPIEGQVKLLLETGEFLGIGEINNEGLVAPKRLIAT